ncbi:MAG: DUF362 domain-containing protein [Planctomycetaceae bacterium]|jgi:uncharacterized protein (DUF362 family)|nr:DUF362 domain-containing protein [Planctomycetaceae bacterium]
MINIIYGVDVLGMTYELLKVVGVSSKLRGDMRVVIKPNLVVAKPASEGATTHPEIVEGIIRFLRDFGINDLTIAEGSWLGEVTGRAFSCCGYDVLAKRYGIRIVDTKKDKVIKKSTQGLELGICATFFDCDFLINVPVLKGHCQTNVTCCLKNLKGCIPDDEKRRYHNTGLHKPIAALNTILKPDIHVIDGICGDPTFEEGGNPVAANRILCGFDPALLDSYCAGLIGYSPDEVEYIRYAKEYGVGNMFDKNTKIIERNIENRPKFITQNQTQNQSQIVRKLANLIDERNACSACYATLIFALNKLGVKKFDKKISEKIKIGQGFRNKKSSGIGVGNCTKYCEHNIAGCPPSAIDIIRIISEIQ